MKTRIIFLDDEPVTNRRLRESLETGGYTICSPQTKEEAFKEINVNGAELLIHGAHHTKTYWNLCEEIFTEYPQFPSIHLATGPKSEDFHKGLQGPFHQKLRPLVAEKLFLKKVRKLIFLGRLNRDNQALHKSMKIYKRLDNFFESLDGQELKNNIVKFFCDEFKADNVFFMNPDSFNYFCEEMWKVSSINAIEEDNKMGARSVVAAKACDENVLSHICQTIKPQMPKDWEHKRGKLFLEINRKNIKSICMVPIEGHKSKKILGHVMMINPLLYGEKAMERTLPHVMRVLGRHLDHVTHVMETKTLSYIDDLTELYNQRYLKLVLDKEINRVQRSNGCFSVLFMDIDHFKRVNDTQGHIVGSKVLVELSKILQDNIRSSDYGFRYGGDEFLMLLIGADSKQATAVAERIRKQIQESTFDVEGVQIAVTISIGIASYPEHATSKEQIIELADRAMYCGKNKSRNIVYVAS